MLIPKYTRNFVYNVLLNAAGRRDQTAYYPIVCCYLVTYRCELKCFYCRDNHRQRHPDTDELDTAGVKQTLAGIRQCCDIIALSGGEPTLREDLPEILAECRRLKFNEIVLNTNGLHLDLDGSLDYLGNVHRVMFGIDSLRQAPFERITGGTASQHAQQMAALQRLVDLQQTYRFDLNVCAVLLPGLIDEVELLLQWCYERRIMVSLSPQIDGLKVHADLLEDPRYEEITRRLVRDRRRGRPLLGATAYFEGIRDLQPFNCLPMSNITVDPMGRLSYPCGELPHKAASFVEGKPYREMVDEARAAHGPLPSCRDRCHHSCYLPLASVINSPWLLPSELVNVARYRKWAR